MPIFKPWVWANGQLQSLCNFQQKFGSNCSFSLKTQFWGPLTENLNPLQRPTHTLTSSSINTQNRSKNYVWIYHGMHWTLRYRQKLSITLKSKDLATRGFQKNSRHTHQNPLKPSPVSERSAYPLQNYVCFSPLTSGLESFGHKSTPSDRPWIEAYCPKF